MGVSNASFPSPGLKSKEKMIHKRSTALKKERQRQVRFDDVEIVKVHHKHLAEKSSLWWTKDERQDILQKNHRLAQDFRYLHRDQVQHCKDVFAQCCSDVTESSSDYLEQAKIDLPTHVRGLEYGILPASKAYRRTHVRVVLKLQSQMQNLQGDMKDRVLSSRAIRSSRPSRIMARILGECDASTAKESLALRRNRCRMLPSWW
jgi:hypothetical protein